MHNHSFRQLPFFALSPVAVPYQDSWWLNNLDYFILSAIILGIIYTIRKYEISQLRLKNHLKIADIEAGKLKELSHLKSQFFANISHEFRSPLTLIKGPLEQLIPREPDQHKKRTYEIMLSNASRLLRLVNQILDLSKIESGNYNLEASNGNATKFIQEFAMSFASLAELKKVSLTIEFSPGIDNDEIWNNFYYDQDILEKIFANLISNAIKFTPENGRITIKCLVRDDHHPGYLEVIIEDTGIGISEDKLEYIFDRFYQADRNQGTGSEGFGLGLAFVKELVNIHKAGIEVISSPGKGTSFILRFPFGKDHLPPAQIMPPVKHSYYSAYNYAYLAEDFSAAPGDPGKSLVLIVEDHAEVRNYIAGNLCDTYNIIEAANAIEGYKIAKEKIPDLIISDVMMPGMDGYDFCEMIKSNEKTCHIPVILLTARADESDRILGLEMGADDYLIKPFNMIELGTRTANLISSRLIMRERFGATSIIKPNEIAVTSRDKSFMEKLLRAVEKNIDNNEFSVVDLGREVGMSQSQIHRKLKAVINMTANQFIRSVRMNRAKELLQHGAGNISEVAFMVGYDDPGYFSKSFRSFFGTLPSEIKKE